MFLEEIDAICAESAYWYLADLPEYSECGVVTAAVDHLDFANLHINAYHDTKINTYVTYVGSSTIHVKCDIYQEKDAQYRHIADAIFIMAAWWKGQAYKCPPIKLDLGKD